jgi:hypothetical protein
MSLSISQQIAALEAQLEKVKDQLKEQEHEQGQKEQVFHITFEYKTNANAWPATSTLDERRVREQILHRIEDVTRDLEFDDQGEQFSLMTVARVATAS